MFWLETVGDKFVSRIYYPKSTLWFLKHPELFYKKEAALQRCSLKKVLLKYAANLQEKTHAEVRFQSSWSHLLITKLQACNFMKKRLQQSFFPVNIAKFVRTIFVINTFGGWFCLYHFQIFLIARDPVSSKVNHILWSCNLSFIAFEML